MFVESEQCSLSCVAMGMSMCVCVCVCVCVLQCVTRSRAAGMVDSEQVLQLRFCDFVFLCVCSCTRVCMYGPCVCLCVCIWPQM